jgi:Fic family protein
MLSYTLTDEFIKRLKGLSDLAAEKAAFLLLQNEETRDAVYKYARISNIGSTTRIENAILTDTEILWIDNILGKDGRPTAFLKEKACIENKFSKDKERSIEEVAGCRAMLEVVYSQGGDLFPLSQGTVCGLHRELLQFYPPAEHYLGRYKIAPDNVVEKIVSGGKILSTRDVLKTADPGSATETAMYDLINWYNKTLPDFPWAIAVATEFVFRFLAIHPFQDGNGRIGRALFTLCLMQADDKILKQVIPYIAIDRHIERHRAEYYLVLRQCSGGVFSNDPTKYDIGRFLLFMIKIIVEALDADIDYYANKHKSFLGLSKTSKDVLGCFHDYPEKRLGLKDILGLTKLPKRTAINALNKLLGEKFLQKYGKGPAAKYQLTF